MESLESVTNDNGRTTDPESGRCGNVKQETTDDWNGEVGLLKDDEMLPNREIRLNSKEASADDLQGQTASHHKQQHHLSWKIALKKVKSLPDPWEKFHIDDSCPTEVAMRHRYNALKKNWLQDEVRVKMELLVSLVEFK